MKEITEKKDFEEKRKYINDIKTALFDKKITIQILANDIGCSRVTIWRFLEKDVDINWLLFVKVIKYLNLKIE